MQGRTDLLLFELRRLLGGVAVLAERIDRTHQQLLCLVNATTSVACRRRVQHSIVGFHRAAHAPDQCRARRYCKQGTWWPPEHPMYSPVLGIPARRTTYPREARPKIAPSRTNNFEVRYKACLLELLRVSAERRRGDDATGHERLKLLDVAATNAVATLLRTQHTHRMAGGVLLQHADNAVPPCAGRLALGASQTACSTKRTHSRIMRRGGRGAKV